MTAKSLTFKKDHLLGALVMVMFKGHNMITLPKGWNVSGSTLNNCDTFSSDNHRISNNDRKEKKVKV